MKASSVPRFKYQRIQELSRLLTQRLLTALASSSQPDIKKLSADLETITKDGDKAIPMTMALVGQYNAGKSTLIKGLTGKASIAIDADVCTDQVTAYDWSGLRIIDTPGIHAGFPGHDDLTEQQISRSHLLIFVITGELFGDDMANYFRKLAFERNHAPKIMLVVNKMDQDPGLAEDKRGDIERITSPLKMEEFRTVFVSGEIYLDALNESDPSTKEALVDESGMRSLTAELDNFAKECGLLGALTAPLFGVNSIALQAAGISSADRPEERATIELLARRARILRESRIRLSALVEGRLNKALADLTEIGDSAAGEITPGNPEAKINVAMTKTETEARARVEKLQAEVAGAIAGEQETLRGELSRLSRGDLATKLRNEVDVTSHFDADVDHQKFKGTSTGSQDTSLAERLRKAGDVAKGVGDWMVGVSTGSKGISGWGKAAAAGSDAHKAIYDVGKLFGYSFKPWEAAGYASKIAKVGKVLGPIAALLQVVGQVLEEKMEDDERAKFQNARIDTRTIFRDGAGAVRQQFLAQFETFLSDFYSSMQCETDSLAAEISGTRSKRTNETTAFGKIADEATVLIQELQEAMYA